MEIFDSHAHYDDEAFDKDREEVLSALRERGITRVVNIGASLDSCNKTRKLAEEYDFIYVALGIHPSEVEELNEESFAWLREQCRWDKCVAVGEIGLDYHWSTPEPELQKKWFVGQLHLARELQKPVVIHSRDAAKDTLDIMQAEKAGELKGVVHCYSYTRELARDYLNMGYYFGIGGVLTFRNSRKLKEAVEYIPLESIVLETDCPYLAPEPYRGSRNSSLYLPLVAEAMAEIKKCPPEEVCRITYENACRLYGLK